jgi:DNA-binding MarR family transcriptional regulator
MPAKVNTPGLTRESELNQALELFHFAFRSFTARPDRILEGRGLQRVHHRIVYFVGRNPDITVTGLLAILGITKQALNAPLRQLLEMRLVDSRTADGDRRKRLLRLTRDGERLERALSGSQRRKLAGVFERLGPSAERAWRQTMAAIAEKDD